jgi:ankyrin repeat protein
MMRGRTELADLLVRRGAVRTATALDPRQKLLAACRSSDTRTIREEVERHPEHLKSSEPLFAAARHNQRAAAELLLDLGTSPDIESPGGERALHIAAYDDSVEVAALLIARGAQVDPIGRKYQNTPLGGALHCRSLRTIDLLCRHSRSIWELGYAGSVDRVRELLSERPEAARATGDGETLLMWLPPHDESKALELAQLLLEHGADASVRDAQNMTAADRAERNAMFEVAALLRARE